jgi:XTP/dITP diphosphohydrolase
MEVKYAGRNAMKMQKLVVATSNRGKVREIHHILSGYPFEISWLGDHFDPIPDIPETGTTFEENARQKASWVFSRLGMRTLADDSGLEVDYLKGMPGVYSARFAGENADDASNCAKLLSLLSGVAAEKRGARFRCVVVMQLSESESLIAEGTCEGRIGFQLRGTNGFGYDPLFIPDGYSESFAQLDAEVKNSISHRGRALKRMRELVDAGNRA